jgi:hypothetical protein
MAAAFQHIPRPPAPPPGTPGEFAFADRDRVHGILSDAGFGDIRIDPVEGRVSRSSLDDAVDMAISMGPVAAALRESGGEKRDIVAAAVRDALAAHVQADGLQLAASIWIAQASAP